MANSVSVIVPVYNEGRQTLAIEAHLCRQSGLLEGILVDASDDAQPSASPDEAVTGHGSRPDLRVRRVATRSRGRAVQMNLGAALSRGSVLLFLHADTRLPAGGLDLAAKAIAAGANWGRFDVVLDAPGAPFRVIERAMNTRSELTGIATGDQAIFVSRDVFDRVGGFPDIPLMEDIELSRRLKQIGVPARIRTPVTTSARRWTADGILRTVGTMWSLRLLYWAGVGPERLARRYRDTRALGAR